VRAVERAETIVLALRNADMVEEDARAFLAEHDAGVRADALAEGAGLLRRQAARKIGRPVHNSGLRAGAVLLVRAADRPPTNADPDFFQPGHTYRANNAPYLFHCVTHTLWPDGSIRALGRSVWTGRAELHWIATELAADDWTGGAWGGWTDTSGEVTP